MKLTSIALLLSAVSAIHIKEIPANLVEIKSGDKKDATCERGMLATVAYTGRLKSNGTVFDKKEAFQFNLDQAQVIECWDEGFKQVPVGGTATLHCPAEMAYGNVMKRNIPENSDLEFDVELIACGKDPLDGMAL